MWGATVPVDLPHASVPYLCALAVSRCTFDQTGAFGFSIRSQVPKTSRNPLANPGIMP